MIRPYELGDVDKLKKVLEPNFFITKTTEEIYHRHPAWTLIKDGEICACGGCVILWNGVGEIWLTVGENPKRFIKELIKVMRELEEYLIKSYNLVRLHAYVNSSFKKGIKFASVFFEKEAILKKYFPDGNDAIIFARY